MDRSALELVEALNAEATVARAGRENDRSRLNAFAGRQLDVARVVAALEPHRLIGNGDLDPELLRLAERAAHQRHAGNAGGEAEVIFDPGGRTGLTAERTAIDRQDGKAFRPG